MDIKVLKAQGYSQRAVAKMMGVQRDTVRGAWDEAEPRKYRRGARASKLDDFKEQLWAHTRAFHFFGGVPERILYDNPKQLVKRPRPDVVWQDRLLAFASHCGAALLGVSNPDSLKPSRHPKVVRN